MTDYIFDSKKGNVYIESRNKFYFISFIIVIFLFMPLLVSMIHELGHYFVCIAFNWEVRKIQFAYFPFLIEERLGYISLYMPSNALEWQKILLYFSGSFLSLIIGSIFFITFFRFRLNKYMEIFLFAYSVVLMLDMIVYLILDVFFYQYGDLWKLFSIEPNLVGIIFLSYFILGFIAIRYSYKILKNLDI